MKIKPTARELAEINKLRAAAESAEKHYLSLDNDRATIEELNSAMEKKNKAHSELIRFTSKFDNRSAWFGDDESVMGVQ